MSGMSKASVYRTEAMQGAEQEKTSGREWWLQKGGEGAGLQS